MALRANELDRRRAPSLSPLLPLSHEAATLSTSTSCMCHTRCSGTYSGACSGACSELICVWRRCLLFLRKPRNKTLDIEIAAWLSSGQMKWDGDDLVVTPWSGADADRPKHYKEAVFVKDGKGSAGYYHLPFLQELESCQRTLNDWGFYKVSSLLFGDLRSVVCCVAHVHCCYTCMPPCMLYAGDGGSYKDQRQEVLHTQVCQGLY